MYEGGAGGITFAGPVTLESYWNVNNGGTTIRHWSLPTAT